MNKYRKCHKCGSANETKGYYGKSVGQRCMMNTGVDLRKASGGWIYCRAVLKAEGIMEAESKKEAQALAAL